MDKLSNLTIPLIMVLILGYGLIKKVNIFDSFIRGAKKGLSSAARLLPTFVALLTAIGMFKASGALDVITSFLAPAATLIGIPKETLPIALLRPVSGSGAIVLFRDVLNNFSADSQLVKIAAVMLSSTETTFYTMAVYFGATHVKHSRFTLISALIGDITVIFLAPLIVKLLFP